MIYKQHSMFHIHSSGFKNNENSLLGYDTIFIGK
jgi:hypothetical protein